jgi:hypothetical protein
MRHLPAGTPRQAQGENQGGGHPQRPDDDASGDHARGFPLQTEVSAVGGWEGREKRVETSPWSPKTAPSPSIPLQQSDMAIVFLRESTTKC